MCVHFVKLIVKGCVVIEQGVRFSIIFGVGVCGVESTYQDMVMRCCAVLVGSLFLSSCKLFCVEPSVSYKESCGINYF